MRFVSVVKCLVVLVYATLSTSSFATGEGDEAGGVPIIGDSLEDRFMSNQSLFVESGKRTGEGYFSQDGRYLVYQSESEPENPFYQIYVKDLQGDRSWRVSPGTGMTSCAWIHPSYKKVLFSSTHEDPNALQKQREEIARRESGERRAYAWDFDENYEIYETSLEGGELRNLTATIGYDAEASWSPDGSKIIFASNRHGYDEARTPEERQKLQEDPAYFMELYIMNADGSNVRRLTDHPGYDGGPFFSPDGQQIIWRRFGADGRSAEIFTMDLNQGTIRQRTQLQVLSWAPYYHPSGEYAVFATNVHGHRNFELYAIDLINDADPIRITHTEGFDGLPVFTPDGHHLAWTSTRHGGPGGQIFSAAWNHRAILDAFSKQQKEFTGEITPQEISDHVHYLASEELKGRGTGTEGERLAAEYVEREFAQLGMMPEGDLGRFTQKFQFTRGISLGPDNKLEILGASQQLQVSADFGPLSYSRSGDFSEEQLVLVGYGIVAPASDEFAVYDSYENMDVNGKWVLAFRYLPEQLPMAQRQYLNRFADLRRKAMNARERGAKGIIFLSGPNSRVSNELIPLRQEAVMSGAGIFALSATDRVGAMLLDNPNHSLQQIQDRLDRGEHLRDLELSKKISGQVEIIQEQADGHNIVGRLQLGARPSPEAIVIGAHIDHLGLRYDEAANGEAIHYGADDNASGSAVVLELAERFAEMRYRFPELFSQLKHDVYFALWSGEELGLLGSNHFVRDLEARTGRLYPKIAAYINMDMIGRYEDKLMVQSVGSSEVWPGLVSAPNSWLGLNIVMQDDPYLPTDSTSFYLKGVPSLSFFTGSHSDYHTPADTADKLNYVDASRIGSLVFEVAHQLSLTQEPPNYVEVPGRSGGSARFRVFLGTIPDYAQENVVGVLLSGVKSGGPADLAGVRGGDIVVALAGQNIESIYDYTYILSGLRPLEAVTITVLRDQERLDLQITPGAR
jgi:Tol biopolymer transport system component